MTTIKIKIAQTMQNNPLNNTSAEILEAFKAAKNPICCIDSRLDFDAFCSSLALCRFFNQFLQKDLQLTSYMPDILPRFKTLLTEISPEFSKVQFDIDPSIINFEKYDLLVYIDSGADYHISNLGTDFVPPQSINSVDIDHHLVNSRYGKLNYVKTLSSACSVLYDLFKAWGYEIDKVTAKLIFLGMFTDSGFFQVDTMQPEEFIKVASLIKLGDVKVFEIAARLKVETLDDIKMKQIIFKNIKTDLKRRVAYSFASLADYNMYDLDQLTHTVPPADLYKFINGIDFCFFVREDKKADEYSISMRSSNPSYDVSAIATKMGGGGHKGAAAFKLKGIHSIQEVIDIVLETTEQK